MIHWGTFFTVYAAIMAAIFTTWALIEVLNWIHARRTMPIEDWDARRRAALSRGAEAARKERA